MAGREPGFSRALQRSGGGWQGRARIRGSKLISSALAVTESTNMFQTLDEQIEKTEGGHLTNRERLARYAGMAVLAIIVFGGLFFLIVALE